MCWLHGSVLPVYVILGSCGWRPAPEAHLMSTKPLWKSEAPNQWVNTVPWNFLACVEHASTSTVLFNQIELSCGNPEPSFYCVKASAPSHLLPALKLCENSSCFFQRHRFIHIFSLSVLLPPLCWQTLPKGFPLSLFFLSLSLSFQPRSLLLALAVYSASLQMPSAPYRL